MEHLVWPRAKVHLYLVEAAHVKTAIGREYIQRNKVAMRELTCLQEILVDLHEGRVGSHCPNLRNSNEAPLDPWLNFGAAAVTRKQMTDDLFEVAALSTHAPSISDTTAGFSHSVLEADSLSVASASVCGDAVRPEVRGSNNQRLSRRQLQELALRLRIQMDEEYTSLLASIEEVQAMMEVEAFVARKPAPPPAKDESPPLSAKPTAAPAKDFLVPEPPRPRWADMCSDESDGQEPCRQRARAASELGNSSSVSSSSRVAVVKCRRCWQTLDRSSFSRRAWRQARRATGDGHEEVACLSCSGFTNKSGT